MIPNGVPVNCSLCQWYALAANYDEACRLADQHLDEAHSLVPETGDPTKVSRFYNPTWNGAAIPNLEANYSQAFDAQLTERDRLFMKMLKIKES